MANASARDLPYGRQLVEEDDIAAVVDVLRGEWLTTGPTVAKFETAFAESTTAQFAIACSSGTAALHLAAAALHIGPDDWVIVPSVTFLATANAARFQGAGVWFADCDPHNGLLTPDALSAAITSAADAGCRIKAVFPVHLNGQACDMASIRAMAEHHGIAVVEDACHALGAVHGEQGPVGGCRPSDIAAFSFHAVKTITAGEGGMVTTNDPALAERMTRLRNHGMIRDPDRFVDAAQAYATSGSVNPWYYEMPETGFNYRLSDIHAALGLSQLGKLDRFVSQRQMLATAYDTALVPLAPQVAPIARTRHGVPAWHLYPVLIDFAEMAIDRAELMNQLRQRGIGTQVHYIPVHRQPYYRALYGDLHLPGADQYYARVLSLPLHAGMAESDVAYVVAELTALIGRA